MYGMERYKGEGKEGELKREKGRGMKEEKD